MADVSSVLHFPLDAMLALPTIRPVAHNTRREEAEFLHCLVCKSLRCHRWGIGATPPRMEFRISLSPF